MKAVDSTIKLVACGSSWYSSGSWDDWNRKILTGLGDRVNYISIHSYWENSPDYYTYMGASARIFEDRINITAHEIQAVSTVKGFKNPIAISVDEYGAFGRSFLNVLPVAQSLNSFIRHADVVKMANFTLATSLLSNDPKKRTFKSPLFYTFQLFSNNCLGTSVDTYVACDTFNTEQYKGIPFLDVTTVYSKETNTVFINVVNRHRDKAIAADIINNSGVFSGKAEASVINSDDLKAVFEYDKQSQYKPVTNDVKMNGNKLLFTFPPHSFTQIKVASTPVK
jgi:alpha-N-arabinofuranosidase